MSQLCREGEGSCESKNCLEAVGRQFLPGDIRISRRALWVAFIVLKNCENKMGDFRKGVLAIVESDLSSNPTSQ